MKAAAVVIDELLEHYVASLREAGMYVGSPAVSVARAFFQRIGADAWAGLSVDEQCDLPDKYRRVVGWLMVTGQLAATPEHLARSPAYLGGISSRLHPKSFGVFCATGAELDGSTAPSSTSSRGTQPSLSRFLAMSSHRSCARSAH